MLVGAADAAPGDATEVVSIIIKGTYFTEPATVRFLVAVEPNEKNRFLWVEAESVDLYRASEVPLDGRRESTRESRSARCWQCAVWRRIRSW
jgi:hypothetical protein